MSNRLDGKMLVGTIGSRERQSPVRVIKASLVTQNFASLYLESLIAGSRER
jgi:hypothetical protein